MSKASDAGKVFLAGVLAKLPENLRAQAEVAFNASEAESALEVIGTGALAQPEINRRMDELKKQDDDLKAKLTEATTLYERNQDWYTKNSAALKEYPTLKTEYDRLKAGGGGDPDDNPPAHKPVDPAEYRKLAQDVVNESGRDYIGVSAWLAAKAVEHLHQFGEPLPAVELVSNPKLGQPIAGQPGRVFSLDDAYRERYGERVTAREKDIHDKAIEAEVQKRLGEERSKFGSHPFPLRGEVGPSVLDVLSTKDGPAAHTVDTAVDAYERLQAARG